MEGTLDALVFVRPNGAERAICWAAETSACRKLARGAAVRLCIEPKDILCLEGEMIGE